MTDLLHKSDTLCHWLDHRLTPEVRALLCAMASRAPLGGISARYEDLVRDVALSMSTETLPNGSPYASFLFEAENKLCEYPLHPVVQEFFDKNVRDYGHSSPMELTGNPAIYVEGVSWYAQWLLFDSPLCSGQEFSTRAVRHKDWPMCREAMIVEPCDVPGKTKWVPDPRLKEAHDRWFEAYAHEVEAWRGEFRRPCESCSEEGCGVCAGTGKAYPWIKDPQAFRPAFDRARSMIPGTFATGGSQTANLRVMDRVVKIGRELTAESSRAARSVWAEIEQVYKRALPGLANMGHREAVYQTKETQVPGHLIVGFVAKKDVDVGISLIVDHEMMSQPGGFCAYIPDGPKSYLDPIWNQTIRVRFHVQSSLAVARDWHRHRSVYPWTMKLVRDPSSPKRIVIHPAYTLMSDFGKDNIESLLDMSSENFEALHEHDMYRAMLTLPLGTCVEMSASGGLRDMLYMLKLRAHATGANFEYEAQAAAALELLKGELLELADRYPGLMRCLGEIS